MTENAKENRGNRATRDEQLLLALASGATVGEAAVSAGFSESTVRRRMDDPDFALRLQQIRGRILDGVLGRLTNAAGKAVSTLESLLESTVSDSVRLGAARAILEHATGLKRDLEFDARLRALEKATEPPR